MAFEWAADLAIGVEEIDEQHGELLRRAERLVRALEAGDRVGIEPLLRSLADYARSHFECEERWMLHHEYPGFEAHRDGHRRFLDEFRGQVHELQRLGPTPGMATAIHGWLAGWMRDHLGGPDRDFGRWLRARGLSPGC